MYPGTRPCHIAIISRLHLLRSPDFYYLKVLSGPVEGHGREQESIHFDAL
jgi:hypothetical protein